MTDLRVRDVTHDDLPAVLRIRSRSFGPLGPGGGDWWERVAEEVIPHRMLAVVDGSGTILAAGRARPYEQVWGGRHLRMGGIAGVYVEPSARGRGVAQALMRGLLARMVELGDVVSCLFPTAPELYRTVGWEVGGTHTRTSYAAHDVRALRARSGGLRPREAGPDDAALVHDLLREHSERHRLDGPVLPRLEALRHQLGKEDAMHYVLDGVDGDARGFVEYSLADESLTVEHLVGEGPEATAALWGLVGSGSSAAPRVHSFLHPRDPGQLLLPAVAEVDQRSWTWMARVVDLPRAVAARGFSLHVTASAEILVDDPDLPGNSGHWLLSVSGGRGTAHEVHTRPSTVIDSARRAEAGPAAYGRLGEPARLGPRGLAALWCGWTMSRLRQAGLATGGDPEADAALDAIFAGTPHLVEYF